MKKIIKELYPYVVIIIVVVLFRTFIATPVRVDGDSMNDTLNNGDILILNKLDKEYKRFDIVVINYNKTNKCMIYIEKNTDYNKTKLVKRIIGLPGENIEYNDNKLYINGELIEDIETSRTSDFSLKELYDIKTIPDNYYFVMGDNRSHSLDSRDYRVGLIKKEDIIGKNIIRLWPIIK